MKFILREITPLASGHLYYAKHTPDDNLLFPYHSHDEYELTMMWNVEGYRVIGSQMSEFLPHDLTLIGPNVLHAYRKGKHFTGNKDLTVVQFSRYMANYQIFESDDMKPVRSMLLKARSGGIHFSDSTAVKIRDRMVSLKDLKGIESVTVFLEILYELATTDEYEILSASDVYSSPEGSELVNKMINYVEKNYDKKIALEDFSPLIGLTPASVSRFFKKKTNRNFWDYLNRFRVDKACKFLLESDITISEVCYKCGFNNLSNFNRIFKKYIGTTPSEYRKEMNEII